MNVSGFVNVRHGTSGAPQTLSQGKKKTKNCIVHVISVYSEEVPRGQSRAAKRKRNMKVAGV